MPEHYRALPYPDFEDYAEVDDGYWYVPRCRSSASYEYIREFLDTRPPVFWTPGQPTPDVVDVDPRVLAEVAYDVVELPAGDIDWNPKAGDVGAAVVNTDTWVWVADAVEQVTARASVPSGTWAEVTAQVTTIDVTAQGADPVTCPGLGTPWTRQVNQASGCAVVFTRSSAHLGPDQAVPTATMTVTATWEATWTSSLDSTPQSLPSQQTTITTQIPVAEIQSLVTTT